MHTYIYTYFSSFIINIYKKNKKLCLISSCLVCPHLPSAVISLVQLDSERNWNENEDKNVFEQPRDISDRFCLLYMLGVREM